MSNKRIRIKRAKVKKKEIIKNQAYEIANLIIRMNTCTDNIKIIQYGTALNSIRMKHIEQIRTINEIIKHSKRQLKGCRIISL